MFKEYFYDVNEMESSSKIQKNAEKYIVKHLNHVVADMDIKFCNDLSLNKLLRNVGEKQILKEDCEYIWTRYHIQRYLNKHTIFRDEEVIEFKEIQELPQKKKSVRFEEEQAQLQQVNQFNILKDRVRTGGIDKEKRDRERAEMELKLFENIDRIKEISDIDSFKPLKYIVQFDEKGNIMLDNAELKDEDVEKLQGKQQQNISFEEFAEDEVAIKQVDVKKFNQKKSSSESSEDQESDSEDSEDDYLMQQRNLIKRA
ncbi:unnamed protein product (macronuclear) [Paramecium tetraurelia]|uniref:Uncharacterized protein n=1 Tax=Paramecium tetraurelia TaxID=5888 RepID=A0D0N3_PARTE|nr:uncharacterized protein GSPATT00012152001 [Paramecium tetraurelia]CAK76600.1 unnamed protein product [Paramecium tetraurelia]|eukprot:XP_001443997.1 hypothetical protein (macronuclear) [Paramecium tetraurelia strain d4-2]